MLTYCRFIVWLLYVNNLQHPHQRIELTLFQAYGPYSASATGGNGMARDFLAGIAALYVRSPCSQ